MSTTSTRHPTHKKPPLHANSPDYPFMQRHHCIQPGTRSVGAEENKSNPINVHPDHSPLPSGERGPQEHFKRKSKKSGPSRLAKACLGFWEQRGSSKTITENHRSQSKVIPRFFRLNSDDQEQERRLLWRRRRQQRWIRRPSRYRTCRHSECEATAAWA